MIIKKNEIFRMASKLLAKELLEKEGYTLTNASFGWSGESIGTICKKTKNSETYIYYTLKSDMWGYKRELICGTRVTTWGTEYQEEQHEKVITTYYEIKHETFTDDEEYAKAAREKNYNRTHRERYNKKTRIIPCNTHLYLDLYNYIINQTGKKVKYGVEIKTNIERKPASRWNDRKIIIDIYYIYRNCEEAVRKEICY